MFGTYGFVPRMQCYHGLVSCTTDTGTTVDGTFDAAGGISYSGKKTGTAVSPILGLVAEQPPYGERIGPAVA
jgi:hypothetical protein